MSLDSMHNRDLAMIFENFLWFILTEDVLFAGIVAIVCECKCVFKSVTSLVSVQMAE